MVFNKVIKHFDGILFWKATVIRMTAMIKLRHQQPSLWHRGLAEDMERLWEPWMLLVDKLLEDEQLLDTVYEAQGERHPQSRMRGRMQTPAEVVLRLLLLKHIRNWSYDVLEREVHSVLPPHVRLLKSKIRSRRPATCFVKRSCRCLFLGRRQKTI